MSIDNRENIRIGDVYMVEFTGVDHEQMGKRPALIFQNNIGNTHCPNVIVLPFTTRMMKKKLPTHVLVLAKESGLPRNSVVMCESPMTISKSRLENYVTHIPEKYMKQIAAAHILSTSAISFLDAETVHMLMKRACKLNQ